MIALWRAGWVAVCLVIAVGCGHSGAVSKTSGGGSIKIDGSSTVYLITEAMAEEFSKVQPDVRVTVAASGTGGGMKKFTIGEIDICDASRSITEDEKATCKEHAIEYVEYQVAFDGLSLVANTENTWCDCLTVAQLKSIWQPESAVNKWSDINPEWPDEKIELFGPGTASGTFEYFTEAIVGKKNSSRSDYTASEDDNMLVTGVEGSKYGLGYFGFAYYEENKDRLKLIAVDAGDGNCVKPTQETVRSNTYKPLSRPLYIYVRKSSLERPEVVKFVDYYLANIEKFVPQVGYVPITDEVAAKNKAVHDETTSAMPAGN